jgi:serine/threonine protein kinase
MLASALWTGPREDPRRYRVDLLDGEPVSVGGGEGLVYRAVRTDGPTEIEVALKMHTALHFSDFERFLNRAAVLSAVHHPHLMYLLEAFTGPALWKGEQPDDDAFTVIYTAARWIPGLSLPAALEAASPEDGLCWVAQVAQAVSELHAFRSPQALAGVLHRDIKPSNVRVTPEGQAVLIDFGIARPHSPGDLTEGAGTYLWRAPEVVGAPGDPGTPSDAWGVGALAYWVLVGVPPKLEGAAVACEAVTLAAKEKGLPHPRALGKSVAGLLESDPQRRRGDLAVWADELVVRLAAPARQQQRRWSVAILAVLALFVSFAALSPSAYPSKGQNHSPSSQVTFVAIPSQSSPGTTVASAAVAPSYAASSGCEEGQLGYEVVVPGGLQTNAADSLTSACQTFGPEQPGALPSNGGLLTQTIVFRRLPEPLQSLPTDPGSSVRTTTVDGAYPTDVVTEQLSSGEAVAQEFPVATQIYTYLVNEGPFVLAAQVAHPPSDKTAFTQEQAWLDNMMQSIKIVPTTCANSTDVKCGPWYWGAQPQPDQNPSVRVTSISPSSPVVGDLVTFTVVVSDPVADVFAPGCIAFETPCLPGTEPSTGQPSTSLLTKVRFESPDSTPTAHGRWTPPLPSPGTDTYTYSHTYRTAGTFDYYFGYSASNSQASTVPGTDPYLGYGQSIPGSIVIAPPSNPPVTTSTTTAASSTTTSTPP